MIPGDLRARPKTAEEILEELGIRRPHDIDVEVIAEHCGATVAYEPLISCEARIVGINDRAIITVNERSIRPRQRFSAAHELGHWLHDRGHLACVCKEHSISGSWTGQDREARANFFAADLLLPRFMFAPLARGRDITFDTVERLGEPFQTSLTATGIRLVKDGSYPAMMICSSLTKGREWFVASSEVERRLWPVKAPTRESVAFQLLRGKEVEPAPVDVDADVWIDHEDAAEYVVREDSRKITAELVPTLLWWKDQSRIQDLEHESQTACRALTRENSFHLEEVGCFSSKKRRTVSRSLSMGSNELT